MIKKFIFVVLAVFGFSSFADMHEGKDHMSDMMSGSDEGESGFYGSFDLGYKVLDSSTDNNDQSLSNLYHRVRAGWTGSLHDTLQWGVGFSTNNNDVNSSVRELTGSVFLEQAYVSYNPVEGLYVIAGKKGWIPDFNTVGVLYDEDIYKEGAFVKYKYDQDDVNVYVKVAAYQFDNVSGNESDDAAPFNDGGIVDAAVGGGVTFGDGFVVEAKVAGAYDVLPNESDSANDSKFLAKGKLHVSSGEALPVPVGIVGYYLTDVGAFSENHSYSAVVYAGKAGKAIPAGEQGDFGVAVNYYSVVATDYITGFLNDDYVGAEKDGKVEGVAVRAQYNVLDNTNIVAKYNYDLGADENQSNLAAELTFNF